MQRNQFKGGLQERRHLLYVKMIILKSRANLLVEKYRLGSLVRGQVLYITRITLNQRAHLQANQNKSGRQEKELGLLKLLII